MIKAGTPLGQYEIIAPLGKGGMGEVWRARDRKLGREVALKTLPGKFSEDADRLARLEREARLLASLNHPNIAAIYGHEEFHGTWFLVLELVEGDTLADQLKRGPMPAEQSLRVALQIAEALDAAHGKGVIHRDLKPANIKVTEDGSVKVLDFGLAKVAAPDGQEGATDSPTMSLAATRQGLILGTAAYMSPEQARGRVVDKRTDVWAFGCILYEMLAGKRLFGGSDVSDVLAAVIRAEPDWRALHPKLHPRLRDVIERCLEKDRRRRYRDIGDVLLELERLPGPLDREEPLDRSLARRRLFLAVGIAALGIALLLAGFAAWRGWLVPAEQATQRLMVDLPENQTWQGPRGSGLAVSRDGTRIAYVADDAESGSRFLYVRPLGEFEPRRTPHSEGAYGPFFSPDGSEIGFFAEGKLWRAAVGGGNPVEIAPVDPLDRGGVWADDGYVYSGGRAGISRIRVGGGERESLSTVDLEAGDVGHRFPQVLPGGESVLFTMFRGDLNDTRVALLDVKTGEASILMDRPACHARYAPTGHLVYVNQGTLLAVPFDAAQKRVTALPEPLIDGISFNDGGAAHFDISDNGLLVYMPSRAISNVLMTWVDRRGNEEALPAPKGALFDPAVSPDGTRLAVAQSDGEESDIWIWDFNRKSFVSRLTSSGTHDGRPVWTPDNRAIAFSSRLGSIGSFANLYIRPVDGATSPRLLSDAAVTQAYGGAGRFPASISPDGSRLYFREIGGGLGYAIRTLDMETGAIETILRGSGTPEDRRWGSDPRVSPDGRWLALVESDEIMLRAISDMESRRWNVSYGPGVSPRWSRDGTELFFLGDREMMAVSIDAGETLLAGEPAALFDATSFGRAFDVSGDGERFLMLKYQQTRTSASPRSPRIVVNWFEELKRRVPKP